MGRRVEGEIQSPVILTKYNKFCIFYAEEIMGKVIPFRKPTKPEPRVGPQEAITNLTPSLGKEFSEIGIEIDPVLKIQSYLSKLRGVVSKNAIAVGRQSLRLMSTEDMKVIARNSNEQQWKTRPGYFRALVDEIRSRL